jgi:hypothetical protein
MRAPYRRAAGPGLVIVLEGLMTLEYESAPRFARIGRLSGLPLTFTSVGQKQRDRWLGPNVGHKAPPWDREGSRRRVAVRR